MQPEFLDNFECFTFPNVAPLDVPKENIKVLFCKHVQKLDPVRIIILIIIYQ